MENNRTDDQIVFASTLGVYYKGLEEYTTALDYLEKAKEVTKKIAMQGYEVPAFSISFMDDVVKEIKESMF